MKRIIWILSCFLIVHITGCSQLKLKPDGPTDDEKKLIQQSKTSDATEEGRAKEALIVTKGFSLPKIDDIPIWRMQLKVKTCNKKYANTDDAIYIKLRNGGEKYYLDYGGNDFERGNVKSYDILYPNVSKVGDIQQLMIGKKGSNGLCIKYIELSINNIGAYPIFRHEWSNGHWLDNDGGARPTLTFNSRDLRKQSKWKLSGRRLAIMIPPRLIHKSVLESMVEGVIGNNIGSSKLYWGGRYGRYVEAWHQSRDNRKTSHIDLDLAYSQNYWADPKVDVDFDLEFSCVNKKLSINATHIEVDVDGNDWLDWLTLGVQTAVVEIVESRVNSSLKNISLLNTKTPVCPKIFVRDDGSVQLSIR